MNPERIAASLDPLVHAPVRLAIMSVLANVEDADFAFLREATGTTDGNLSTHLRKLEAAGYIVVRKEFVDRKPHTTCAMTRTGRTAFTAYLEQLEQIIASQRSAGGG